ncbi:hypothetical protein As57867_002302, partial [Aphanomyces stellatus]
MPRRALREEAVMGADGPGGPGSIPRVTPDDSFNGKTVTIPGVLVGIPIGIVLLLLGFCIAKILTRYRTKDTTKDGYAPSPSTPTVSHDVDFALPILSPATLHEPRLSVALDWRELEHYRLDMNQTIRIRRLAGGGFGSVWLGTYANEPVAIKVMDEGRLRLATAVQRFLDEVKLMARLEHPNVVRFIGACWQSLDAVNLVVEYMDMGDLKDQLDCRAKMSWVRKVHCATDILRALVYLHDQNIIHRDLKSRNVLMDSHKPCKLSDFGISRELVSRTMSHEVGTFLWAAPEVLKGGKLTVAADIYSFGMLLSELDTHQVPFDGLLT